MHEKALAIEASQIGKDWGDLIALYPTDLVVEAGELVALVGHNGAGKTTLLALLSGTLEATSGKVSIYGNPAGSLSARADLSYVADTPVFYDDLSLAEHIEYIARLHRASDWKIRGDELLDRLRLANRADDLPARFSRGLKQRASMILGLIRPFRVLLADEPTTGLDADSRTELLKLLQEARAEGAAVLVSAHQPELLEIAGRCIGLRDGMKIYDGSLESAALSDLMS